MNRPAVLSPRYREGCYWLDGVELPRPAPRVDLPAEADVVVVGAGYTGTAAAWELARRGKGVLVLEQRTLGWGASTRNGGMVLPDVKHGLRQLIRRFGSAGPAVYRATLDAVRTVEELTAEDDMDCDYSRWGHLELAHCADRIPALRALERVYREDLGLDATFVAREDLPGEIGSDAYAGALAVELSGGLHPARYFAGLARRALAAGAEVREDTPVVRVERDRTGFLVRSARGTVRSGAVLVATNGYTGGAFPWLRRRVVPVGSYIIATEPIEPALAKEISPRGRMFFDTKNFLFYWRLSPDGTRVLFGGRASFAPTTVARARDYLYRGLVRVHPQLEGIAVEYAWGGNVALTLDRTPRLGRRNGLTYSLGYSGTGVAAATWYGIQAARWLCGEDRPSFADLAFPAVPLQSLRSVTLPVAGLWYKARDRCRGR